MRKINYGLIVSDFDGTLVRQDGTVSEKNIKVINEYIEAGGIFAISTGRVPAGILPQARKLGLKGLVSCCQGTIIFDIESGKILFDRRLSFETTLAACRKMEEMGLHIHAYDLWVYYSNADDGMLKGYEKITGVKAKLVLDRKLSEFIEEKGLRAYKLLAMVEPEDSERTIAELSAANLPDCAVTKSSPFLAEVVNDKCSKGSAVLFLAEHYGIEIEKTVGIGDYYNDMPMIEAAGLGAAVGNAEDALKQRADYICENTNETDAVAEVIEKFGFSDI